MFEQNTGNKNLKQEEYLLRDADYLGEVLYLSVDAVLSLNADNRIIMFNPAAEKMFGYLREEILGQSLDVLIPEKARKKHEAHLQQFRDSKSFSRQMGQRNHVYGRHKDGHLVPLDIAIQKHPGTGVVRYTAICRDITQQLEQERDLTVNSRKFEALFNASHQVVIILSEEGIVQNINLTGMEILTGSLVNYLDRRLVDCDIWSSWADREAIRSAVENLNIDQDSRINVEIIGARGRDIQMELTLKKISFGKEEAPVIVIEGRDVSRRVAALNRLTDSQSRLSRAQEIAKIGSWDWDVARGEMSWSDELFKILGVTKDNLQPVPGLYRQFVHPEDKASLEFEVTNAIEKAQSFEAVYRIVTPDGTIKNVRENGEITDVRNGIVTRFEGTVQDISEHHSREFELNQARLLAEEANRAKGQFLATMSHELRTPLNAIIGFSSILESEFFGELGNKVYREYAKDIHKSGEHLLELINDILDVSRIDLGTVQPNLENFDLEDLVQETFRVIDVKAREKGISLVFYNKSDVKDLHLDRRMCKQILINLLGNALKFSDNYGEITVTALKEGSNLVLKVKDQGIGMTPEERSKIFEPFIQAESAFARKFEGVGLGLTIVKNLTELQGGKVGVESEVGKGSQFDVTLPLGNWDVAI
ncbi:MAG: PAS domain S-box protein [Alphaproteobacteria bacterium]|nr:PAS domain S-box protein [Alphaproteobacteria bacterium]